MPSLNFTLYFQQHLNWCWAADSISVQRFYEPGATLTQCALVNQTLGRANCCNFTTPWDPCNSCWNMPDPLTRVGHYFGMVARPVTFDELKQEIDGGHPLVVRVAWWLGGAHFINCTGYYETVTGNYMLLKDPTLGVSLVPYALFPKMYWGSLGTWTDTYFTTEGALP